MRKKSRPLRQQPLEYIDLRPLAVRLATAMGIVCAILALVVLAVVLISRWGGLSGYSLCLPLQMAQPQNLC